MNPQRLSKMSTMKYILLTLLSYCTVNIAAAQTCGTTNLAAGRPMTGTSAASYENASVLVDGDVNTHFWPSDRSTDQWGYVQLASSVTICRVVVKWKEYHQGAFKVQVMNTNPSGGGTWTDIATVTSNNNPTIVSGTAINDLSIPNSYGTNQYVRLLILAPLGNVQPVELEVYSSAANNLPTVSISSPANNASFTEGSTVTINANAADNDGTISKVEFYQGSTKLGEDLTNPYSYAWTNVSTGNYALTAKAYDNAGGITTSSTINITVVPPPSAGAVWSLTGNAATPSMSKMLGTTESEPLIFTTNNIERARINESGQLIIGATTVPTTELTNVKLAVNGDMVVRRLKVTNPGTWADFVFSRDYKLPSLRQLEEYIKKHQHLPGVPSAEKIQQNGLDIAAGQTILMQKIEELTLYVLEQNKRLERQEKEIKSLKKQLKKSGK